MEEKQHQTNYQEDSAGSLTPMRLLHLLSVLLGNKLWQLYAWTGLMAIVYFLTLLPPYIIGKIVNFFADYHSGKSEQPLYWLIACAALVSVSDALLRYYAKPSLAKLAFKAAYQIKVLGFERLMDQSVQWHDKELSGTKVQRLVAGGSSLERLIDQLHSNLLPVSITFLGVAGSFFLLDLMYALYALAYILLFWGIQVYFFKRERNLISFARSAHEAAAGAYTESANNILTIKTLNLERGVAQEVSTKEEAVRALMVEQKKLSFTKNTYFRLFDAIAAAGFMVMVSRNVLNGSLSPGSFIVLATYFRSLYTAVGETISFMDSLVENWITVGRLAPLIIHSSEFDLGSVDFPASWKTIELRNVDAVYGNGKVGVKNLSLKINRGEHIGIVGSSGSGKSSLGKVLLGVLPTSAGSYFVENVPFKKISTADRASIVSAVLQDSELFNLSLADNISVMRDIPAEKIHQAIEIACLAPVIEKLDKGLNELIGEKGYRLSGGERQRVGIARAVCKDPQILVLDEATSALDGETEEKIHSALQHQLGDKTLIIIAHRLSTLRDVDRIVVMEDGQVVEEGSVDDLLRLPSSRFKQMWESDKKNHSVNCDYTAKNLPN
jgi:ABC-type multidrug transport system fused ATPase/permease subunit